MVNEKETAWNSIRSQVKFEIGDRVFVFKSKKEIPLLGTIIDVGADFGYNENLNGFKGNIKYLVDLRNGVPVVVAQPLIRARDDKTFKIIVDYENLMDNWGKSNDKSK
jgi:hypothetical protein